MGNILPKRAIINTIFDSFLFLYLIIPTFLSDEISQLFVLDDRLTEILDPTQEALQGTHILILVFIHVTHVRGILKRLAVYIVVTHVGLQTRHDSLVRLSRADRVRVGIEEEGGGGDWVVVECVGALVVVLCGCGVHHSQVHL